jgi:O-antigen/teichoic acid export membrane protein
MRRGALARLLGGTVLSQAFLSGAGFLVAFVLLRQLGPAPYGFYVLANVTMLLLASLQGAFFLVPLVLALSRSNLAERQSLVGWVGRSRAHLVYALAAAALGFDALAWASGLLASDHALLIMVGGATAVAVLHREFCRGVLQAYHCTGAVLRGDLVYIILLIGGSIGATFLPLAAVFAVASMGVAALVSGQMFARALWRFEPWDREGSRAVMRDISTQGGWAVLGAAVHWSFSQGYTYLVAALLDVRAVAAIAATRLLLMPVNLLSSGVTQAVYPLLSRWHEEIGLREVLSRLLWIVAVLLGLGLLYAGGVWLLRDWLFEVVLKKTINEHDQLLLLWSGVFMVMLVRDQIGSMLVVRSKLRSLSQFTTVCSVLALLAIWLAVPIWGAKGAVASILIGEALNMAGMLVMLFNEARRTKESVPS